VVLRFEFKVPHLLGRCSTTWATLPAPVSFPLTKPCQDLDGTWVEVP
jgi:hypothetical protein